MKRLVILGGGESGFGSAVLGLKKGYDVFLSDKGPIADKYKQKLVEWNVPYEEKKHTEALILNADEVVKSPGIPEKAPIVQAIRAKGIPVISEIEFAGRYTNAKTICITGSNGKTTTTTLTYKILKEAGFNVGLAGNIGESFALAVATHDYDWYVIELSSFQLDGMYDFKAHIAVLMNITPDHLDRYDYKMQNYVDSKFRILQNQTPVDRFVFCADDPVTTENLPKHPEAAKRFPFSVRTNENPGAYLDHGHIVVHAEGKSCEIDTERLIVKGIHNTYNVMAASLAALAAGVEPHSIVASAESFAGVEHRLEPAGSVNGVLYINDSKATNVDSVWYALESMTRPVVWIAGGTDKGNDYAPLVDFARSKVKTLVCMGLDNDKLIRSFTGVVPEVISTASLEEAMLAAAKAAAPGDVVLLSPACASFDLFKNYEDRGEKFKAKVLEMQQIDAR